MGETLNRQYPFPGIDDAPAGPFSFEELAGAVDADVTELVKNGKGVVARVEQPELAIQYGGTPVTSNYVTASLVAGRWYSARYRFSMISGGTSAVAVGVFLRKSATGITDTTGTELENAHTVYTAPTANQGITHAPEFVWKAAATESVNLKIILQRLSGVATFDIENRRLVIEDLGSHL